MLHLLVGLPDVLTDAKKAVKISTRTNRSERWALLNVITCGGTTELRGFPGEYGLMIVVGAILLIAFGAQHCSNAAKDARHLTKGSLIINVNEATAEELQTLPDVGPARAARIIQNRPYESVDGLFEKGAMPKAVVDANRSLLKTSGKNERTARYH